MRIFVLAVLAGITAAHVYPKGLKSRQDPESLSLPKCSVPCLENNGVTLSCIEGAGSDKKSDQCICDAFRGLSGPNIERCIEEVCNVKDIMDLEAYLAQACFGASDIMISPREQPLDDEAPGTEPSDDQLPDILRGITSPDATSEVTKAISSMV
ncbi:hypothetical protein ONZ51_g3922 [Trametes cubensis]|uniref:Extracellular membrane protein CFEM domain-containing protein n=1 Tax=Trametes cubensis TaxID=1111947 RepID=A0AAD7TWT9_9APHY|nr:hypothetical protein ONZ51_g3922 [Trametes cubensis]